MKDISNRAAEFFPVAGVFPISNIIPMSICEVDGTDIIPYPRYIGTYPG